MRSVLRLDERSSRAIAASAREAFELDPLRWAKTTASANGVRRAAATSFPLGELDHGRFFLGLDEHGGLYLVVDWLARFGRMPEAVENLVFGVVPVPIPDSAQP